MERSKRLQEECQAIKLAYLNKKLKEFYAPKLKKMHLSEDLFEECGEGESKESIESARPYHDDLLAAIEDGFVDYETVAKAALKYMSDDDIKELCRLNDFNIEPVEDLNESDSDPYAMSMKEAVSEIIEKFGNNAHKYRLKAEEYVRYGAGRVYSKTFKAPNDYLALFSMALHGKPSLDNLEGTFEPAEILGLFKKHPTFDALLDYATSVWWGDGDDYIISLTNLDTGSVLYEADYELEDEDDDSYDYDESLHESYTPEWAIWVKNTEGEWRPWGARSEFPSSEDLAELKDWLFDRGYKDLTVLKNNGSRPVAGMYEDFKDEYVNDKEVEGTPNVPDTPKGFGVATLINNLIQDEWQAIQGYNDAIATLSATDVDENIINVFRDIANEENIHVGQLQKALELVSPNVASIAKGEEEAGKQLEESKEYKK